MGDTVPASLPVGLVAVECENGVNVLRMAGEIDAVAVAAFELEQGLAVIDVVDLSEVTYLSSIGIGLLLQQTRSAREQGNIPMVRGLSRQAGRVLDLVGLAYLFQVGPGTPALL